MSLFDTNEPKAYHASPIPSRAQLVSKQPHQTARPTAKKDLASFVEIEIGSDAPTCNPVTTPTIQPIKPVVQDEKRNLFYAMRQIARNTTAYTDHSKIFYEQGQFMKDFEDDYPEIVPFSSYFPYYQRLGYEQLRTYFTWRTNVRNGNIAATSTSYAFIYIYELLNLIGVTSPEEGLRQLMTFWQSFRIHDPEIDGYILPWLKDYHIYYPLSHSFQDFVAQHQLMMHYPAVFGYESTKQNSFDLFAGISKYNIKKSVFYHDETHEIMNDCFYFILDHLRKLFQEKGQCFEDLIFYPLSKEVAWTPFNRALFYPTYQQADREVALTKKEGYQCKDSQWRYKSVMLTENGRQLVGYIMKEMEAALRKVVKFKYKLTARLTVCDDQSLAAFARMGIHLPELIGEYVKAFYTEFTRKIITVDVGHLQQIRAEALQTQEKLIVPEEAEHHMLEPQQPMKQDILAPVPSAQEKVAPNPWSEFKNALTSVELEALTVLLDDKSLKDFAMKKLIMLEVLVDGINEKAMDCIGDTLLELDQIVIIYHEYKENLMEMVKS